MSVVAILQGTEKEDRQSTLTAVELARRLNTPVTGLFALPDPNAVLMVSATPEAAGLTASTAQSIIDMQLAMKQTAETAFHDVTSMGAHGLDCDFFHEVNTDAFIAGPVIIAWDGSNGAARAVRFHLPLIRALGDVIIAQAPKDLERDAARPAAEPGTLESWLKRHGVTAKTAEIDGDVGSGLLALAKGSGASMIVAGAYGHSRLGERLFGGTTRRMLESAHAPVLALAR